MTLSINLLTEHIGAEVQGVDLASPIGEETFAQLRDALYRHAVLVFHGQQITDEQQVAFTEGLGTLEMMMPSDPAGDGGPIAILSNLDENGEIIPSDDTRILYTIGNTLWHSDGSFRRVPLRGSLLAAKAVPPTGGETEFASTCASYVMLPDEKKAELQGLVAEHSMAHSRAQIAPDLISDAFLKDTPPVEQLVVRTIPETGAKALLVGSYAARIIGWPIEKGQGLLQELLDWVTQPQFVYRHNWCVNDLLVYDNRCCVHRGRPWDRSACKRVLHRTTLAGDGPMT